MYFYTTSNMQTVSLPTCVMLVLNVCYIDIVLAMLGCNFFFPSKMSSCTVLIVIPVDR